MLTYTVLAPILHPVAARPGDVLVFRFGRPDVPAVVTRPVAGGWVPIRTRHVTPDAIADALTAGTIMPRASVASAA
jgi:hypothetical protein